MVSPGAPVCRAWLGVPGALPRLAPAIALSAVAAATGRLSVPLLGSKSVLAPRLLMLLSGAATAHALEGTAPVLRPQRQRLAVARLLWWALLGAGLVGLAHLVALTTGVAAPGLTRNALVGFTLASIAVVAGRAEFPWLPAMIVVALPTLTGSDPRLAWTDIVLAPVFDTRWLVMGVSAIALVAYTLHGAGHRFRSQRSLWTRS